MKKNTKIKTKKDRIWNTNNNENHCVSNGLGERNEGEKKITDNKPTRPGHHTPLQIEDEAMRNNMRQWKLIF
jgi:hypothetical protein